MTEVNDAVLNKIRKLLALAEGNANQHEAEVAANMAQKLLTEHGISMLAINKKADSRKDTRMGGGLYKWQRELWENVAKLNFCMYWNYKGLEKGSKYEHRLLGSEVNVISTRIMAEYLQDTVERMARERVGNVGARFFIKENIEYREGVAKTLANRLGSLRWEREQEARAAKKAKPTGDTTNALTILDVITSEEDANIDHLYGAGYSARRRAEQAELVAAWERDRAAKKIWREENPELAAAEDAAYKKADAQWAAKAAKQKPRRERVIYKSSAYFEGVDDGHSISLNQQVDKKSMKQIG